MPRTGRLSRAALVTVGLLLAVFGAARLGGDHTDRLNSAPSAALHAVTTAGQQAVAAQPGDRNLRVSPDLLPIAAIVLLAALLAAWSLVTVAEHRVAAASVPLGWHRRGPPLPFTA